MSETRKDDAENLIERMLAAANKEKTAGARPPTSGNPSKASTAPEVMRHMGGGAGSATQRSGKGGKSGGGMGGQQAGGMKGGGKRKTHAGRK
jgi:hypothetical protein